MKYFWMIFIFFRVLFLANFKQFLIGEFLTFVILNDFDGIVAFQMHVENKQMNFIYFVSNFLVNFIFDDFDFLSKKVEILGL